MGMILPLGDPVTHFWLTRSMARVMGVSLSEAMAEGKLSATQYTEMVTRCRTCPHVGACKSWLAEAEGHSAPAEFCANAEVMTRLKRL